MHRFAEAVLKAVKGEKGIVQPSFVYLPGVPGGDAVQKAVDGLEYFSTNVELGVLPSLFDADDRRMALRWHILSVNSLDTRRSCSRRLSLNSKEILRKASNLSLRLQSCNP
jgi:hypothetical protein